MIVAPGGAALRDGHGAAESGGINPTPLQAFLLCLEAPAPESGLDSGNPAERMMCWFGVALGSPVLLLPTEVCATRGAQRHGAAAGGQPGAFQMSWPQPAWKLSPGRPELHGTTHVSTTES